MAKGTDVLSLPAAAAPEELLAFQTALSTFGPSKRLIEVLKELGEGALDDLIIALAEGKLSDAVAAKLKVNPTLLPPFLKKAQELLALCTKSREPEAYQPFVPPAPEAPVKDVIAIVRTVRARLGEAQAISFLSFEEAVEGIGCSRIRQAALLAIGGAQPADPELRRAVKQLTAALPRNAYGTSFLDSVKRELAAQ